VNDNDEGAESLSTEQKPDKPDNEALRAELSELKARLASLRARIEELETKIHSLPR